MCLPQLTLLLTSALVRSGALRLPERELCEPPGRLEPGCGLLVLARGRQYVNEGATNWVSALLTQDPIPRCSSLEAHVYTDEPEAFEGKLAEHPSSATVLAEKKWSLHLHSVDELARCAEDSLKDHDLFKYYLKALLAKLGGRFETTILADTDIQLKLSHALAQYVGLLDGGDLVASIERNPFYGSQNQHYPFPPGLNHSGMAEFRHFPERNTGFVVLNMKNPAVRELPALWARRLAECMEDRGCQHVLHDQPAFREALFELRHQIKEEHCTPNKCCREAGEHPCPPGVCTPESCWFWHAHRWDLVYGESVQAARTRQCECA